MDTLKYITANRVDPTGKPAVFLSCHPDDLSHYLTEVCERLLKIADCAVYYDECENGQNDESEITLEQMRLFVMPITRRLLESDCRAIRRDLQYAFKHKKPILPLMFETGLEKRFSEVFGNLQFLDPNQNDATAIRFEDKLRHYLDSVLLDDETEKQIRASFDAHIFMSYRKKDRKHARELMQRIHAHPRFRDIAIWYDEFLTAGENFNDEIRKHLLRSDLFTLVVTPHLLELDNYVMTIEYKTAMEAEKKILPVTMVHTDPIRLSEHYRNMPIPIDGYCSEELSAWMEMHLKGISLRSNTSAAHEYLIGLAYLNGINVEINADLATELISRAAENGLPDAMQKLAAMYHNGEAVDRDYQKEAYWLEKAVDAAEERYKASQAPEDLLALLECLEKTRFAWYALKQTDRALAICQKQMRIADAWQKADPSPETCYYTLRSRMGAGDIYLEIGQADTAGQYYAEAIQRMHASKEILHRMPMREVPMLYERMAHTEMKKNRLAQAEQFFRLALRQREAIHRFKVTHDSQRDLALSYDALGLISLKLGKKEDSLAYYQKALEIKQGLCRATDSDTARQDLCISYYNIGNVSRTMSDIGQALDYLTKAHDLAQKNLTAIGTAHDRFLLGRISLDLAKLFSFRHDSIQKNVFLKEAQSVLKALDDNTGTFEIRELRAQYLLFRAEDALRQEALDAAQSYCDKAIQAIHRLCEEMDSADVTELLFDAYRTLAELKKENEEYAEAKKLLLEILELHASASLRHSGLKNNDTPKLCYWSLFKLCKETGESAEAKQYAHAAMALSEQNEDIHSLLVTALQYKEYADFCMEISDEPEAERYYTDAIGLSEKMPAREAQWIALQCCDALSLIALHQRDIERAEQYALLCVTRCKAFLKDSAESENVIVTKTLADALRTLANIRAAGNDRAQAKQYYLEASQAYAKCAAPENYIEVLCEFDNCMSSLGELCEEDENLKTAKDCYEDCISSILTLYESMQDDEELTEQEEMLRVVLSRLSARRHQLGRIFMKLAEIKEAETCFLGALAIDEKFAKEAPTEQNLRNLTADYVKLGDIRLEMDDADGAETLYKDALRIDRAIAAQRPSVQNQGALASACYKLGALKQDTALLREALSLCEPLVRQYPTQPLFRMLYHKITESLRSL